MVFWAAFGAALFSPNPKLRHHPPTHPPTVRPSVPSPSRTRIRNDYARGARRLGGGGGGAHAREESARLARASLTSRKRNDSAKLARPWLLLRGGGSGGGGGGGGAHAREEAARLARRADGGLQPPCAAQALCVGRRQRQCGGQCGDQRRCGGRRQQPAAASGSQRASLT